MKINIPNQSQFEKTKDEFKKYGLEFLHVLADFDRTLTYGVVDGQKTPSIISMLRDGNHLSEEYAKKAHALFDKYNPFENDQTLPLEERKKLMEEWRSTHNELLIKSGLQLSDLEDIVANGHVKFREGIEQFLDFLHEHNIPLVIISASGCGDAIKMFFQKIGKDFPNMFYVTNQFQRDEYGKAIAQKLPIIHGLNKDETVLKEIPEIYEIVKNRKNVILMGDSIGDLGMIAGFDYENLLKIGFLNGDYDKSRSVYEENFDVVLEGDGDLNFVNSLLEELIDKK